MAKKEVEKVEEYHVNGGKFYEFLKRTFDIIVSGLFLLLFGWLIVILLLIKFFEDFHRPWYTSIRIGKDCKPFHFHKIRSMHKNADKLKRKMMKQGLNEADGPVFKMKEDPRITPFGKFLRKTSLDELLQFWDVFRGKMSIVGPRPPLPEEVKHYSEKAKHRLDVKGGLVCYWQITKHRHDLSFDEWVDLDLKYISTRSVGVDLKILFKAIWFVLTDRTGE